MTERPQPLREHLQSVLGPLPKPAQRLCAEATPQRVEKGRALLRDGERWQSLWWVARGVFRLYYLARDGQASNKNFYLDGAMFWPITPELATQPVAFWVEAVEGSEVWSIPWPEWQAATRDFAPWQVLERRVLAGLLQDKMQREQQFLQCSAAERYQALQDAHVDWLERIPLRHLASYLGITDVALSRIRRRLKRP